MFTFKVFNQEADLLFEDVIDTQFQTVEELEARIDLKELLENHVLIWSTWTEEEGKVSSVNVNMNKPGDFAVVCACQFVEEPFYIVIEPQQTESQALQKYFK